MFGFVAKLKVARDAKIAKGIKCGGNPSIAQAARSRNTGFDTRSPHV
jgi:hypothetical protein